MRAFFVAILLGAFASLGVSSSAQTPAAIHIATIPVDAGSEVFYAADQGFFKNAGLEASIDLIPNGGAIIAAVTSRAVDIGYSNVFSLAQAIARGAPIRLIAGAGLASEDAPTAQMVVDKSSPLTSAKDLNGKIIAVDGLRTISEFTPRAWMDKNGGDSSTVKFIEVPFPEIAAALATHRVDAALLPEPFLTRAKATVTIIGDPYQSIAKQFLIGAYFTSTAWAQAHPDLVKRFQEAIHETAIWANKNHPQTAAILAKYSKIDPATLTSMGRVKYAETITPAMLQPAIDVSYKYHAVDSDFPAKTMILSP
jgi:ABC-type nitrate/sulfonate/bicarbonate transport system substrate-binding protein